MASQQQQSGDLSVSIPQPDDAVEVDEFEVKSDAEPELQHTVVADSLRSSLERNALTVVVYGGSGHLARTKTYPALYALFCENVFPRNVTFVGYARSNLDLDKFHKQISEKLKGDKVNEFLQRCLYFRGKGYDDEESFAKFDTFLCAEEARICKECQLNTKAGEANRLHYLATPPGVFVPIAANIKKYLMPNVGGWTRVIVEKPFGKNLATCDELLDSMGQYLTEKQCYRIDHYLAKEMVQNILTLRFSNTLWDTLWDRKSIQCVKISMKEAAGVDGRGGYYDEYGVICDVFQNHLLQVLTLIAMEAPVSLSADDVRDEKVKVLKAIEPPPLDRVVVGQYCNSRDGKYPGYLDDESVRKVNPYSRQITFAQMVLFVKTRRWNGVPFICKCGKGLDAKNSEVRIQFKNDGLCLFPNSSVNELVIRLQPREAIWLKLNTKKPGFARFDTSYANELDLTYQSRFGDSLKLPEAYTRLILDSLMGDQSLFVREDELRQSWRIVSPILHHLTKYNEEPIPTYHRGSRGPPAADHLTFRFGFFRDPTYAFERQHRSSSAFQHKL